MAGLTERPIAVRMEPDLQAALDRFAGDVGITRSAALRLLVIYGLQMDEARRSWREQGDAVDAVHDLVHNRKQLTPETARGRWEFNGLWGTDNDGQEHFVLEPEMPKWWALVSLPPAVTPGD